MSNVFLGKPSKTIEWFVKNTNRNWQWFPTEKMDPCPQELMEFLNSGNAPKPYFRYDPKTALPPYKGFWQLEGFTIDGYRYDHMLLFGMGNETELGIQLIRFKLPDTQHVTLEPFVIAKIV